MASTPLSPSTSTRAEYTANATSVPLPPSPPAHDIWVAYASTYQALSAALAAHPAMAPNLHQTYNTPAADKNRVYFMWDFVGRTLSMLFQTDPSVAPGEDPNDEVSRDVLSRTFMSAKLILDHKPGMLDQMVEGNYPEQRGKHPAFGEEILELARKLYGLVGLGQEGEGVERCKVCMRREKREEGGALLRCGGCREALYCSRECQKTDWKKFKHKDKCRKGRG